MPGPKQPIALVQAKGAKHLTKAEIAKRQATEISAPNDKIEPPAYLSTKRRKQVFVIIARELVEIGIMTNLDVDALARYVIAQELYVKASKRLLSLTDSEDFSGLLKNQDKLFRQCRSAAMDLGLTISSRCRLVMPKPKEPPSDDPFDQFDQFER